jgi:glutathione S-transferase
MAGCVFLFRFAHGFGPSGIVFDYIGTEFADIAQACQAIKADGWITGERLTIVDSAVAGELLVIRRVTIAFRASGVVAIELPRFRFVDEVPGVTQRAARPTW